MLKLIKCLKPLKYQYVVAKRHGVQSADMINTSVGAVNALIQAPTQYLNVTSSTIPLTTHATMTAIVGNT